MFFCAICVQSLVVIHRFVLAEPRTLSHQCVVNTTAGCCTRVDERDVWPIKGAICSVLPFCCSLTGDVALILFILTVMTERH